MSNRNSRFRNDINSRILSIVETIVNDNYELHRNHRSSLDNTFDCIRLFIINCIAK